MITSRFHKVLCLLLLCFPLLATAGSLDAWLDRTQIAEGETVRLTLEARDRVDAQPDLAPLEQDFDILGTSSGSRMTIINGRTDARTTWTIELSPKHGGTLSIPALQAGSAHSAPLQLQVSAAPVAQAGPDADIAIETELSTHAPYVQGQVLYTVRLLSAVAVRSGQLSAPEGEHLLVQQLGADREYASTRNGRRYQVVERRYALFPQASGSLAVSAPVFDGEVPDQRQRRGNPLSKFFDNDPFFSRGMLSEMMTSTRHIRVRGEQATLDVRARPDTAQGSWWLPATGLELHGDWQPDGDTARVGEPLTLQLDLQAGGLTGGQLPDIVPGAVDGFDVYPDQAQRDTEPTANGVTGHLHQKIAFIPRRPGSLEIPAIDVYWWDTAADREQHASLPARTLQVAPASGQVTAAPAGPAAQAPKQPVPAPIISAPVVAPAAAMPMDSSAGAERYAARHWRGLSAALATGWLLTLLLWWLRSRRNTGTKTDNGSTAIVDDGTRSPGTGTSQARSDFLDACKRNDAAAARRSLLAWAALHWPDDPPGGLEALAQRLPDRETRTVLGALDRAVYAPKGYWDGSALARLLTGLPEPQQNDADASVLAPLYPEIKSSARH